MGGCVMPPHRSMRHRHALTFPSDRRPLRGLWHVASQSQLGSQATSARVHTEGESHPHQSHSGRQTERGRPGRSQMGGDFSRVPEAPPPKKRSGPSQGTPEGRKHPFPPHPPRQWEDPRETQRGGAAQQGAFQGREEPPGQASSPGTDDGGIRQRSHGIPGGASPTFPCMQDIPERLRLRLGWTPRPVPGSSKPSLILLHAGKDDAGALDAYLHAYNPAFSEYIWAMDIRRKGGDLGQDMLGEEPYSTMCSMAMAGKVPCALVGGGPNCRTWSILRWFPKPGVQAAPLTRPLGVALVGGGVTSLPRGPTSAGGHRPAPDLAGHLATQEGAERNRSSRNWGNYPSADHISGGGPHGHGGGPLQ